MRVVFEYVNWCTPFGVLFSYQAFAWYVSNALGTGLVSQWKMLKKT